MFSIGFAIGQSLSRSNNDMQVDNMAMSEQILLTKVDDLHGYASLPNRKFQEPPNSDDNKTTSYSSNDIHKTVSVMSSSKIIQNFGIGKNDTNLLHEDDSDEAICYDCSNHFDDTYITKSSAEFPTNIYKLENSLAKGFGNDMQHYLVENPCLGQKSDQQLEIVNTDNSSLEINDTVGKSCILVADAVISKPCTKTECIEYNCSVGLDVDAAKDIEKSLDVAEKDSLSEVKNSMQFSNQENSVSANREDIVTKQDMEKLINCNDSVELEVNTANDASESLKVAKRDFLLEESYANNIEVSNEEHFVRADTEVIILKQSVKVKLIERTDSVESEWDAVNDAGKDLEVTQRDFVREVGNVESSNKKNIINTVIEEIISKIWIKAELIEHKNVLESELENIHDVKQSLEMVERDVMEDSKFKSCKQESSVRADAKEVVSKQMVEAVLVNYEDSMNFKLNTINNAEKSQEIVEQDFVREVDSNVVSFSRETTIIADAKEITSIKWIGSELKEYNGPVESEVAIKNATEKCVYISKGDSITEINSCLKSSDEENIKSPFTIKTNDQSENMSLSSAPALKDLPVYSQYSVISFIFLLFIQ